MLDFSRNENRQLALSLQPTDLVDLCEHVAAVHWSKARSKRLQLRLDLDHRLPAQVELDPHRVQQVLHNLLANAIKFSSRGEVVLWARRAGSQLLCGVDDGGPASVPSCCRGCSCPLSRAGGGSAAGPGHWARTCHLSPADGADGGEIRVEPRPTGGSRFLCALPLVLLQEMPRWRPRVASVHVQLGGAERDYLLPWLGELGLQDDPAGPVLSVRLDEQGLRYWDWQGNPGCRARW